MNVQKKVQDAINKQINNEFYASYLYLGMAAYFKEQNLHGFANWMFKQSKEETGHGMKLFDYLIDRQGHVELTPIDKAKTDWESPLAIFQAAYNHELKVTASIHALIETARSEKDKATEVFLNWFVNEQVEEENSADEIVQKLKMVGSDKAALLMLDKELGKRVGE